MKLTKEQAAIIGCYTGVACGPFSDIQDLASKLVGEPLMTHEFAQKELWVKLKALVKPLFLEICHLDTPEE